MLATRSLSSLDLSSRRLELCFILWLARSSTGSSHLFLFLQLSKALHTSIMLYAVSLHLGLGRSTTTALPPYIPDGYPSYYTTNALRRTSFSTSPYLKSAKILPSRFHCSFSTNPHKALHPFTKSPLAVTSALNSSTGSCGMATMRFFLTLTFARSVWVWVPRLLLI